jgi:hypothetical protein
MEQNTGEKKRTSHRGQQQSRELRFLATQILFKLCDTKEYMHPHAFCPLLTPLHPSHNAR